MMQGDGAETDCEAEALVDMVEGNEKEERRNQWGFKRIDNWLYIILAVMLSPSLMDHDATHLYSNVYRT